MKKRILTGALIGAFALSLPLTVLASGDIEPKDTVQNPGPGGLDVPMEKMPKAKPLATPAPSPLPNPKGPATPKS